MPAVLNPPAESRNILLKNLRIIARGRGALVVQKYVIRPILYKSKKVLVMLTINYFRGVKLNNNRILSTNRHASWYF